MGITSTLPFIETGAATAILPARASSQTPIVVIGTEKIRSTFDALCVEQALNSRGAPGVTELVLNPDAHCGYGAPIGCVLVSPTHVYPGPVGVDIKCSMSLLQMDVEEGAVKDVRVRRALIDAILERVPTGAGKGQRSVRKSRRVGVELGRKLVVEGASAEVLEKLGIPLNWAERCEDAFHVGHDETRGALVERMEVLMGGPTMGRFEDKVAQLGSYGGGNHFGECEVVEVDAAQKATADAFGLKDGKVAFLSHCGSRGFGYGLAHHQFKSLQGKFEQWGIPLPGGDKELVYAPLGTKEADAYIDDMSLGANFATLNHLLINALVLEAFQEVLPGTKGELVYFISHNIARKEVVGKPGGGGKKPEARSQEPEVGGTTGAGRQKAEFGGQAWVHRKGATRAFPAGHPGLKGTVFAGVGHPILLPGNPQAGSVVMVATEGAAKSCYSVNHGAGRMKGRKAAIREFDQGEVDRSFVEADILSNCRQYPKDEAPKAYKDFEEVLKSVKEADLAKEVARLRARFVIKDADMADD